MLDNPQRNRYTANMMKVKWLFNDGATVMPYDSFPFAYRAMYNALKNGVEKGRKYADMVKSMSITGPVAPGVKAKTMDYTAATQQAKNTDVLSNEGQLNRRAFPK